MLDFKKATVSRIAALLTAMCPCIVAAHPCPYDWNIEFAADAEIKGATLSDFVVKFNEAVKKETKDKITRAIIFEPKPDILRKVPDASPFSKEMDVLLKRYAEVTAPLIKKGFQEFGTAPIAVSFPAKFPVACLLAAQFSDCEATNYEETKEGARVILRRAVLECRSYRISARFLEEVRDWEGQSVPYVFAKLSGMKWAFYTLPNPAKDFVEDSFIDGVTLYLPEQRVVLAIETKDGHEKMTKVMQEKHFLESPSRGNSEKDPQPSDPR